MVFDNIFDAPVNNNNVHPMSNSNYSNDVINDQGKQYKKYQKKRRSETIKKNKGIVEGFVESMTANEKNENDLATLVKLQKKFDAAVSTMSSASTNAIKKVRGELNNPNNKDMIYNKFAADPDSVDGIGTSKGCRVDSPDRVLPIYQGEKTHEECAQRAHDLGKTAYGIQDSMGWGGNGWGTSNFSGERGQCFIGDADSIGSNRAYHHGDATWSSGNTGMNWIFVGYNATVKGFKDGDYKWTGGSNAPGCSFWKPGINNITATYGMNCQYETKYIKFLWWRIPYKSKRSSVYTGNETRHFESIKNKEKGSVQISAGRWGDPAYGCGKKFNATYNCGGDTATKSINLSSEANGKTANFDCSDLPCSDKIPYRLVMQNDGNLVLYDKANQAVWETYTSGKSGDTPNKDWINSSANIGDTLYTGERMNDGYFLCSENGHCIASLSGGSFTVYQNFTNCRVKNGKNFGGGWTNAVYTIDKNDVSTLGNVANVVQPEKREFPERFLTSGTKFTAIQGYSIEAEGGTTISGKSLSEYKKLAAGDNNIALFTTPTNGGEAIFYTKNCGGGGSGGSQCFGEGFPTLQNRRISPNWTIYVKNPEVISNDTCGRQSEGISLATYNNYKSGAPMRDCSPCGLAEAMHEDYCTAQSEEKKAADEAKKILEEMKRLATESVQLQSLQPKLRDQIFNQISIYNDTYKKVLNNENTIITTGAQKDDADLQLIADNFQFVMWSIIAILAVTFAMRMVRKSN